MRHSYRPSAVITTALTLALSLGACSGASSPESASTHQTSATAPATKHRAGAYPQLDPFVGCWVYNSPNGQGKLSLDQLRYMGYLTYDTSNVVVYLLTKDGQPMLAFTRAFGNRFPESAKVPIQVKPGGRQLVLDNDDRFTFTKTGALAPDC